MKKVLAALLLALMATTFVAGTATTAQARCTSSEFGGCR